MLWVNNQPHSFTKSDYKYPPSSCCPELNFLAKNCLSPIYKVPIHYPAKIIVKTTTNGNTYAHTFNITHFRLIQKPLLLSTESFTYSFELKVVVKGVPTDVTFDELTNCIPGNLLPFYLVIIVQYPDFKQIFFWQPVLFQHLHPGLPEFWLLPMFCISMGQSRFSKLYTSRDE